jgi:hypothetical protein
MLPEISVTHPGPRALAEGSAVMAEVEPEKSKPAMEHESKPAMEHESKPAMEHESKPAMEHESKP